MTNRRRGSCLLGGLLLVATMACDEAPASEPADAEAAVQGQEPSPPEPDLEQPPRELDNPVPLWADGEVAKKIEAASASSHNYLIIDLGEAWTPYLFTNGHTEEGLEAINPYRKTYLALARGEFPDDVHGDRAREDKYLELYGIMPTLSVLRERFEAANELECARELDLQPLVEFDGFVAYRSNDRARKKAQDMAFMQKRVRAVMKRQGVGSPEQIDVDKVDGYDKDRVTRYFREAPEYHAVRAAQKRLECEGYFEGRGRFVRGALDWPTHDALAEFERRHRVYGWGYIGKDTMRMLRMPTLEAEREGVLRVLTERAMHAAGVIEDGSMSTRHDGEPRTYVGADGRSHPIPNLEKQLRAAIIEAFGLQTPESTLEWLRSLEELPADEHRYVAFGGVELPEYYDGNMDLTLEYDRGDVWYEFPFDDNGDQKAQPVSRRPKITLFVRYEDQKIPLARFGTTIGGWRSEQVGDTIMWKYKESPVGPRVWSRIVAAPVWLPPDSTPSRALLKRNRQRKPGEPKYVVDYDETGPSYASAYGLVAAYHQKYLQRGDEILLGGDEGIRTHGSVDYMSIMRRHSHGCHRLHNHIAVRLMSFVLAHRPHRRLGEHPVAFKKTLEYEDETYELDIDEGGYVFKLEQPIKVVVHEGRIRGDVKEPIAFAVPRYDQDAGAYMLSDGGAVEVQGSELVRVEHEPDAGVGSVEAVDVAAGTFQIGGGAIQLGEGE